MNLSFRLEREACNHFDSTTSEIDFPIVQAALSGYSDWPMRIIAHRLGAPYTLCEVMLDRFVVEVSRKAEKPASYLQVTDEEHPVGGQLMGADPANFAPATKRLVAGRLRCDRYQLRLPRQERYLAAVAGASTSDNRTWRWKSLPAFVRRHRKMFR